MCPSCGKPSAELSEEAQESLAEPKKETIRVKITSDGMPGGTQIVDAKTGKPIQDICEVQISIANKGKHPYVPTATLEIGFIPFELECEAELIVTCDECGRKIKLNPKLKIIFCIRDPVKRAISMYKHDVRWSTLGRHVPLGAAIKEDLLSTRIIHQGRYALHLRRYLGSFDPNQIYLFSGVMEGGDVEARVRDLFDFLNVEPTISVAESEVINRGDWPLIPSLHHWYHYTSSWLVHQVGKPIDAVNCFLGKRLLQDPVSEDEVEELKEIYRSFREKEKLVALQKEFSLRGELVLDRWEI